jgi:hypothetical protein
LFWLQNMEDSIIKPKNFCACGCGTEIELLNFRGQIKRYVKGHNVVNFVKHGAEHPSWKGGKAYDKNGYVIIWHPNHPRNLCGNYVHEHVLVMEDHLGRLLNRDEIIHHKNEIKDDNRLENLQLMTELEHKSYHTLKMWKQGKYDKRVKQQARKKALGYSVVSIIYWRRRWNWLYHGGSIGIHQFAKFI